MKLVLIIIAFIIGLVFCSTVTTKKLYEGFTTNNCPNLLIQKGSQLHLLNTEKAKVPGINPMIFKNLEEYVEFVDWQRKMGIKCPILYFQKTIDTQGNNGYRMLPNPLNKHPGLSSHLPANTQRKMRYLLDSNRNDLPYNNHQYAGFDQDDQRVGVNTPLDSVHVDGGLKLSDSAMDTNWGGVKHSRRSADSGKYKHRTRTLTGGMSDFNKMTTREKEYHRMKKKSVRDEAYRQEDVNFAWRRNEPGKTIASQDTMQFGSYNKYYDQSHYNDQTPESDDETETMVTDTVNTETATTETVNTDMVNTDMVNTDTATTETVNRGQNTPLNQNSFTPEKPLQHLFDRNKRISEKKRREELRSAKIASDKHKQSFKNSLARNKNKDDSNCVIM